MGQTRSIYERATGFFIRRHRLVNTTHRRSPPQAVAGLGLSFRRLAPSHSPYSRAPCGGSSTLASLGKRLKPEDGCFGLGWEHHCGAAQRRAIVVDGIASSRYHLGGSSQGRWREDPRRQRWGGGSAEWLGERDLPEPAQRARDVATLSRSRWGSSTWCGAVVEEGRIDASAGHQRAELSVYWNCGRNGLSDLASLAPSCQLPLLRPR